MSIPLILDLPEKLKYYIEVIIANPRILHEPELAVIKKLIEHFGGKIPKLDELPHEKPKEEKPEPEPELEPQPEPEPKPEIQPEPEPEPEPEHESEREESDLELDTARVVEPGTGVHQKLEYLTLQPTEEEIAESQAKRSEAVAAFIEKDYEKAIEHYTEAIMLNPQASLLYAKRGEVYLSTNKLSACIRDCNRALELNPDSAAAHKFRGRAYHLLGIFEEAANDLRFACKFDFDEQADEWLREVTPNARKIEEFKRKMEREAEEKLEHERQERLKKARESAKVYEENTRTSQTDASGESAGMGDFYKFLNDPDVLKTFMDPEVAETFKEISTNPTNILKYQNNPKIMAFINKMASKFGAAGGMPGGFPGMMGGMPGFPSADRAQATDPKPNPQDDVGLD